MSQRANGRREWIAITFALASVPSLLGGCQLYMAAPVAHVRAEPGEWGPPTGVPGYIRVAGRFDSRFQYSGPSAVLQCGVSGTDPANTIELDVFLKTERAARVRVAVSGVNAAHRDPSGASRTSDGALHWYLDRRFHDWRSGDTVTLVGKATLAIVIPWEGVFGHGLPREGDEFNVQCDVETEDGTQRATGRFRIEEVTRFKELGLAGH